MTIDGTRGKDRKAVFAMKEQRFGMGRKAGTQLGTVPGTKEKLWYQGLWLQNAAGCQSRAQVLKKQKGSMNIPTHFVILSMC